MANLPRPPTINAVSNDQGIISDEWNRWFNQIFTLLNSALVNAPSSAPYIIQTANALLANAQALSQLSTGFVKVTNGTGVLSSQVLIKSSDIDPTTVTGTGNLVEQLAPTINGPTLTAPVLGQPVSGDLSNCTTGTPGIAIAIANKDYVDSKPGTIIVTYATTAALNAVTYAAVAIGVGDTLTFNATGVQAVDGSNLVLNDIVLVKNQADATQNGVYLTTTAPAVGVAGILTRAVNYNTVKKMNATNVIYALVGSLNAGANYYINVVVTSIGPSGTNIGFTRINLPFPSATSLGGIQSIAAVATKFISSISTLGTPILSRPNESDLSFTDITTNNVSTSLHGFAPKLPNDATKFLDGTGAYSVPGSSSEVILISRQTAATSASIDFTSIAGGTYDNYLLTYQAVVAASNNVDLWLRISQAGSFLSTSIYSYSAQASDTSAATGAQGAALTSNIAVIGGSSLNHLGTGANSMASGQIHISNAAQTTNYHAVNFQGGFWGTDGVWRQEHGAGVVTSNIATDGFRMMLSSGNITSGTFALYGIKNT